jgi:hypothetical protein
MNADSEQTRHLSSHHITSHHVTLNYVFLHGESVVAHYCHHKREHRAARKPEETRANHRIQVR